MQLYRLHLRLAIRIQEVVISVAQEPNRIETDDDNNNDHNSMIFGKTKQEQCQKMILYLNSLTISKGTVSQD